MRKRILWSALFLLITLSGCVGKATYETKVGEAQALSDSIAVLQSQMAQIERVNAELREERSRLESNLAGAHERNSALNQDLLRARADLDRLEKLLTTRSAETGQAMTEMRQTIDRLEEQNRALSLDIERERLAREARLAHLKNTYDELVGVLESEIQRGEITISELQGRLTLNMVDRILFDSGKADLKTAGLEVLRRVGDTLKNVTDREIRVEGHTDNVPISPRLQETFPSNWELSTARAHNVVHFLQGRIGIPGERLAVVGYGPYRPIASNATAEGRAENRRIQIILAPFEENR